jgi:phosphinothricin acetyltransferase
MSGTRIIRLARETDAEPVRAIYAPLVRETAVSFEWQPPSVQEMGRRIASTLTGHPWLVCEDGRTVVGYAYAGPFRSRPSYQWTVEVTVYVHPDHRGRGVGRRLYRSLLECLRIQGYHTAIAAIALPNAASVRLHEALGFRPVGVFPSTGFKLGRWHDTQWWTRELQSLPIPPPTPRRLAEVADSPEFRRALEAGGEDAVR